MPLETFVANGTTEHMVPTARGGMAAVRLRSRVRRDTEPAVLGSVRRPGVDLAIWERSLPRELADRLDGLPPEQLPRGRFTRPVEAMGAALAACWPDEAAGGGLAQPWRDVWIEDVLELVGRFAVIVGTPDVEVRVEAVGDNACSRFHADCVTLRLLTTYRGPGTQWIEPAAGDPPSAGSGEPPADSIRHLPRFAVGLFKGRRFAPGHGPAILHRSPPVAGTGITRLLLCLNPPAGSAEDCCP